MTEDQRPSSDWKANGVWHFLAKHPTPPPGNTKVKLRHSFLTSGIQDRDDLYSGGNSPGRNRSLSKAPSGMCGVLTQGRWFPLTPYHWMCMCALTAYVCWQLRLLLPRSLQMAWIFGSGISSNQGAQSCLQRQMGLEISDSHQAVWVQPEGEGLLSSHMGWWSGCPSVISASLSETSTPRRLPSGLGRKESAWEGIMTSCTWRRKGSTAPDGGQVQNLQRLWVGAKETQSLVLCNSMLSFTC